MMVRRWAVKEHRIIVIISPAHALLTSWRIRSVISGGRSTMVFLVSSGELSGQVSSVSGGLAREELADVDSVFSPPLLPESGCWVSSLIPLLPVVLPLASAFSIESCFASSVADFEDSIVSSTIIGTGSPLEVELQAERKLDGRSVEGGREIRGKEGRMVTNLYHHNLYKQPAGMGVKSYDSDDITTDTTSIRSGSIMLRCRDYYT